MVRCFDDAEIIHVEGDVDPIRDLDIISEELRIKDIEFVEKALEKLKKETRRGGQSLEMKKLKEEEATVERILALLQSGKDVRKEHWGPKEVSQSFYIHDLRSPISMMNKSYKARIIPALRTAQPKNNARACHEMKSFLNPSPTSLHPTTSCPKNHLQLKETNLIPHNPHI